MRVLKAYLKVAWLNGNAGFDHHIWRILLLGICFVAGVVAQI
jgi:hypothetical protein